MLPSPILSTGPSAFAPFPVFTTCVTGAFFLVSYTNHPAPISNTPTATSTTIVTGNGVRDGGVPAGGKEGTGTPRCRGVVEAGTGTDAGGEEEGTGRGIGAGTGRGVGAGTGTGVGAGTGRSVGAGTGGGVGAGTGTGVGVRIVLLGPLTTGVVGLFA